MARFSTEKTADDSSVYPDDARESMLMTNGLNPFEGPFMKFMKKILLKTV